MDQVIFARHGESEYNSTGRINADPRIENPLTVRGIEQAEQLGVALSAFAFEVCFTSELLRARQTAEVALRETSILTEVLPQLNEPAAGEFEGGPVDVNNDWVVEHGYAVPNPGGESQFDALRRFIAAFELILNRPESTALVVAHALPMAWLMAALAPAGSEAELSINFKEPGVEMAVPLRVSSEDMAGAIERLRKEAADPVDLGCGFDTGTYSPRP